MLTPNGGVFGRNPKFNNVTVDGDLTVNGDFALGDDIVVTDTLTVNGATTLNGGLIARPNAAAPTSNVTIGTSAGAAMDATTDDSIAIGRNALLLGTGDGNVCVGATAGDAITTSTNSVCVGVNAAGALTTGTSVVAVGHNALSGTTTTSNNTAVGAFALSALTGSFNVGIGSAALYLTTTGASGNVAVGHNAMSTGSGSSNVAVGRESAHTLAGNENVSIGLSAGRYRGTGTDTLTSATSSVFIGHQSRANDNSQTNQVVIAGTNGLGDGSNTVAIGNTDTTQARIRGGTFLSTGANGQSTQLGQSTTLLSALSGATVTATNLIPANCILLGVTARVTTAITGATTFDIGDGSTADRFGDDIAIALNTTANNCIAPALITAATNVVLTANGSNFTAGAVRLTAHFMTLVAPIS